MLQQRPLSVKENKLLNEDLKSIFKKRAYQLKFLTGWSLTALIVGTFFYFRLQSNQEHYLLFGVVSIYILIGCWTFLGEYFRLLKKKKSINFALSKGVVNYIRVIPSTYIELTEYEDEGTHYLFQLDNNRILSLGGQDRYPSSKFPNTDFEIVLCLGMMNEMILLHTYNYGKKLKPTIKISGKEKWALMASANYPDPEKFTIISGRIENYKNILKLN